MIKYSIPKLCDSKEKEHIIITNIIVLSKEEVKAFYLAQQQILNNLHKFRQEYQLHLQY